MLTEKQLKYIKCLEEAATIIEREECAGCCTAVHKAAKRVGIVGVEQWEVSDSLHLLIQNTFRDIHNWLYYWNCDQEGKFQRVLALSFLIDMIETENLYAD